MRKEAKEKINLLINKYKRVKNAGKLKLYTEEETKKDFILPLFEALGWEVYNKNEVSAEQSMSSGRVDYGFYLNDRVKFFIEAKKISADLHKEDFANQAVRYSWNKGATWAILTDFESIIVFNAQDIKRSLADKLYFEIFYNDYINRFEQLWLLSKESFQSDLLDKDAEAHGKKFQKIAVTSLLYEDLEKCRDMLTKELSYMNEKVTPDLLDEGVQKLLDRLIFIRVAEDRGVEDKTLIPLVREARFGNRNGKLYESMVKKFREFDNFYNSNLFLPHPFEQWEEYSGVTERVISTLYGKSGYYEYDFKAMPADVLGAVYESYLGHRLSKSKKGLTVAKDAGKRKEHGIYYTPSFIVDYIVKNALGPVLDTCQSVADLKKIKILDPACGSGSFLIKAFNMISDKYKKFGTPDNEMMRIQILRENIYGVDLDPQAVEITRLNLLINTLSERMKLPSLDNIKNGNSLSFNWQEEFSMVFKQGGFDVVIGNPPYITQKKSEAFDYEWNTDLYLMFFELILRRGLLKPKGQLGFITPRFFLVNKNTENIREYLLKNISIESLVESSPFLDANTECVITIIKNVKPQSKKIPIFNEKNGQIEKINEIEIASILKNPNLTIITNITEDVFDLLKKIEINTILLKDISNSKRGMEISKNNLRGMGEIETLIGEDTNRYNIVHKNTYVNSKHKEYKRLKSLFVKNNLIFLRRVANSLIASISSVAYTFNKNIYGIEITENNYDPKYILALINSKMLSFYYRRKFSMKKTNLFPEIQKYLFNQLPIKKSKKETQKRFINMVDCILALQEQFKTLVENSEKWNLIKSKIEKVNRKIDEEVYRLYDITLEEIKIIEASK